MATAQEAPATAPARRPTESPQRPAATTAPHAAPQRVKNAPQTSLTFDQFMQGQLALLVAVALIFSAIAYAAITNLPVGTAPAAGGATAGAVQAGGGGSDAPITAFSGEAASQQIPVGVDTSGALKWDRTTYEAQAGDVTFVVTNKSSSTHNFAVEGPNVTAQGPNFGANTTNMYTLKGLKPGTYQIICNFPGHKAAGMVATLIVK